MPHTNAYLEKLLRGNLNGLSMYGIKNVLKKYGIETTGVFFEDKSKAQLAFPCILHFSDNRFVIAVSLHNEFLFVAKQ